MRKQSLEDILKKKKFITYNEQYSYVIQLIEKGKIKPVKASPTNGRRPALHIQYWIIEDAVDYSELEDELLYRTEPEIVLDYYLKNLPVYAKERDNVRLLNDFIRTKKERLMVPVSYNERCFEIWGYEKFLTLAAGKTLLRHCGLELSFLNCYPTAEPFAYYTATRETPQNILIIENKDTFFSMRKAMLRGQSTIFGMPIGTLIYGAGKRVISSFQEFSISAEPYMQAGENRLLYFGDLDYEGIGIYEKLALSFREQRLDEGNDDNCATIKVVDGVSRGSSPTAANQAINVSNSIEDNNLTEHMQHAIHRQYAIHRQCIVPFVQAYIKMLDKAEQAPKLPVSKDGQNHNISHVFYSYFDRATVSRMQELLETGAYIPQEILNISDF